MKFLAISGSLRKSSYNTAIIKTLQTLAKDTMIVDCYGDLANLPLFNPDLDEHTLEEDHSPLLVQELRKKVSQADALIISTPEYAFEIPGALKNALDWLVSSSVIVNKPVAIISASTSTMGGEKAHKVLSELMQVLSGEIIESAKLMVSRVNKKIDENGRITDAELIKELDNTLTAIQKYVKNRKNNSPTEKR